MKLDSLNLRAEHHKCLPIDSKRKGLVYYVDPKDDKRIAIACAKGMIVLTRAQLNAVVKEAIDIMDTFCGVK